MDASQCSIFCGENSARLTNGPRITSPKCGFDTGSSTLFVPDSALVPDFKTALADMGLARCEEYTQGVKSDNSRLYIENVGSRPSDGGCLIDVTYRGLHCDEADETGCSKFCRMPYSAETEFHSTSLDGNTIVRLVDETGATNHVQFVGNIAFTQPNITWQECYIADERCFDPCDANKRNLCTVGFGTNTSPGPGDNVQALVTFDDQTTEFITLSPSSAPTVPPTDPTAYSAPGWTLTLTPDGWELTNGAITMLFPGNAATGPLGNYSNDEEENDTATVIVDSIVDKEAELTDWYKLGSETPVGVEQGFPPPLTPVTNWYGSSSLITNNINWGIVLTNRQADEACPGSGLWSICDTYVHYQRTSFSG